MAKPNFQFEKRQKELEKKRRSEEKLRRKQEKKAAGVVDHGTQGAADAPTDLPGSNDVAPTGQ